MKRATIKDGNKNVRYISRNKQKIIMPEVQLLTKNRLIPVMHKLSNKGNMHCDCNKMRPKIINMERHKNKPTTLLLKVIPSMLLGHTESLTQMHLNRNKIVDGYCIHEKKSTLSRKTSSSHVVPLSKQTDENREEILKNRIQIKESNLNYFDSIPLRESKKAEKRNYEKYLSPKCSISNESLIVSSKSVLYNDYSLEFSGLFSSCNRTSKTETTGTSFLDIMMKNLWKFWKTPIIKKRVESKGFFPHRQRCNQYPHKLLETRSCPDHSRLLSSARIAPLRNGFNDKKRLTVCNRSNEPLSRKIEDLGSNIPSLKAQDFSVLYKSRFRIQDIFNDDIRTLNTIGDRNVSNRKIEIACKYKNNSANELSRMGNLYVEKSEGCNIGYSKISNRCKITYSWQVVDNSTQTSKYSLRSEDEVNHEDKSAYPCSVKYSWQIIGASTQVCLKNFDDMNYWSGVLLVPRKINANCKPRSKIQTVNELNVKVECKKKSGNCQKNRFILNNQQTQTIVNQKVQVDLDSPRQKYSWQNIIETARLVAD